MPPGAGAGAACAKNGCIIKFVLDSNIALCGKIKNGGGKRIGREISRELCALRMSNKGLGVYPREAFGAYEYPYRSGGSGFVF